MIMSKKKTVSMHVREQDRTTPTTREEDSQVSRFPCPYLNCDYRFMSLQGLRIHMSRCEWKDEFEVDQNVNHRGPVVSSKEVQDQVERSLP